MEFREVLFGRKSIRAFADTPVSDEQIRALLDAAVNAPSACNMQSWHFYVVRDAAVRASLSGACSDWVRNAPLLLVICTAGKEITERFGSRAEQLFILQDTALAAENILLAAYDLGLGGCFVGAFDEERLTKALSVPADQRPVILLPIGVPAQDPPKRERKPLGSVVTFCGGSVDTESPSAYASIR